MNKRNAALREKNSRDEDFEEQKNTDWRKTHQGKKVMRHYHLRQGRKCHAFDILLDYYNLWRQGDVALRAEWGIWPNGDQPAVGQRIRCGSCQQTGFLLGDMVTEVVTL